MSIALVTTISAMVYTSTTSNTDSYSFSIVLDKS